LTVQVIGGTNDNHLNFGSSQELPVVLKRMRDAKSLSQPFGIPWGWRGHAIEHGLRRLFQRFCMDR
jgi:hypothetical protein